MSQVQINFTIDPTIKAQAQKRAQADGLNLKAVLVHLLKGYNQGHLRFGIQPARSFEDLQNSEALSKEADEALSEGKRYDSFSDIRSEL